MDYKLLGNRIRTERQELKLTQEKLAEIVGISDAFMGFIERGERIPSVDTLVKIANALGCTVDSLLDDSNTYEKDTTVIQFAQMANGLTSKQKQMILDVIRAMTPHFGKE